MNTWRLLGIAMASGLLAGCGTPLLQANFDRERVGSVPSAHPPGAPDGDRIFIPSLLAFPPPPVPVLMVSTDREFSGNVAIYVNTDLPVSLKYTSFFAMSATPKAEQYWATWNGRINGDAPLEIWFFVGHYHKVAVIRFQGLRMELMTSVDPERYETIATLSPSFAKHVIVLKFNTLTSQYSLTVLPGRSSAGSSAPIVSGPRRAVAPGLDASQPPGLNLLFPKPPGGTASYVIDDLLITESCPRELRSPDGGTVTRYDCG